MEKQRLKLKNIKLWLDEQRFYLQRMWNMCVYIQFIYVYIAYRVFCILKTEKSIKWIYSDCILKTNIDLKPHFFLQFLDI